MSDEKSAELISLFTPDFSKMSAHEVLDFIARSRRQLDRMELLPGGRNISPQDEAVIRKMCDELEASIRSKL
jgi:hypothetical protein